MRTAAGQASVSWGVSGAKSSAEGGNSVGQALCSSRQMPGQRRGRAGRRRQPQGLGHKMVVWGLPGDSPAQNEGPPERVPRL